MTENTLAGESIPSRRSQRATKKRGGWYFVRDLAVIVVIAILASFLVKTFLVRSFYIPSGSMENTLIKDDRILVNELVPNLVPIQRGDVVVFRDPGGWLPVTPQKKPGNPIVEGGEWLLSLVGLASPDSNDHLIKRVIGLPGDRVECCNALGQMMVNGVPLDEPYVKLKGHQSVSEINFDVVVPEGSLWVMGDNRYDSLDSRFNQQGPTKGFVPIKNVVGRAFVITWPFDRWGGLGNYPEVFDGVGKK
ncbi:signal peptidase I [Mycetocola tolaasinivorans]|uniref:Signal peptidase I n=1 Tax=Mycetocola tolaasinivorans TaxID=76635 RepID=A0A3L7A4Q6_9MICO|nr:signal peptidase I [Mycetocola tolaasinivorans]RLP75045.1 signal peptidase I [Mycetocola tolaasinivorans]